ncbi:MAG TPA: hypothetical protein PLQ13_05535 [Candidatus Krumholzibacteria bacterium]|nr:hypothetical protein [Candidatus Krumholzibacteria bacterium]
MMQGEIDTLGWAVPVRIHGVNEVGQESGNALACEGRDIPWLQETLAEPVWGPWHVRYRDVVILDGDNVPVGVYNLTDWSLADSTAYATLRGMLQAAAEAEAAR